MILMIFMCRSPSLSKFNKITPSRLMRIVLFPRWPERRIALEGRRNVVAKSISDTRGGLTL